MTSTEDADLALARQLQEQFDRELIELSSGEEDSIILATELQKRFDAETIELSEGEDDDVVVAGSVEPVAVKEESPPEVKFYRAERRDLNAQEYFIEELQTYVDPENNFEWKFVEIMPDLKALFLRLDELFFQSRFRAKNFRVLWSQAIGRECTNRNFNDPTDGRYTIALNETLLALRPRIEIISILLHEMIHAYLKLEGVQESNNGHGANFRKMMIFINRMLQTNISFSHRLTNTSTLCRTEWYRCTGICHNYKPFHGIVRSSEDVPGLHNEWWRVHAENCGGTFYKIYEMSRIDEEGEVSTRYAVNVRYMKPKREDIRGRYKSRLPPKESIDLTSDTPRVIPKLTETVSLDDAETSTTEDTKSADKFIQNFNRSVALTRDSFEMQCPICQDRIKRKLFGSHIDGCKGVVQRIQLKRSAGQLCVQDGMEENRPSLNPGQQYGGGASTSRVDNRTLGSSSTIADYQRIKRKRFL